MAFLDFIGKKSRQIKELQQSNLHLSNTIVDLENKISSLINKNSELSRTIENNSLTYSKKIQQLESNINVLKQKNELYCNQNADLSKQNQEQKDTISTLEGKAEILEFYEERFGHIPYAPKGNDIEVIGDYDRDKDFFDFLLKEREGKQFSPEQIKAIRYQMEKHMRIIAGAGSGKTETICAKAAYFIRVNKIPESRICMITFTTNASAEMETRVNKFLGVEKSETMVGTFHSVFMRLYNALKKQYPSLKDYGIQGDDAEKGEILYRKQLAKLIKQYELYDFNKYGDKKIHERISFWTNSGYSLEDMVSNIQKHFDNVVENKTPKAGKISERFYAMMLNLNDYRKNNRIVIYDDFLLNFYNILREFPEARSFIQGKFDYIFIDEFQDTNQLQINIMKLICPCDASTNTKIIIVGDDDQSIYMFRAAEPKFIKEFNDEYTTDTFELMRNYRSKSEIVLAANRLISYNKHDRIEKSMIPFHDNNGDALIVQCNDIYSEANWIIDQAEKLGKGKPFTIKDENDVEKALTPNYARSVIVYRAVGQLQGIIRALDTRNIPYVIEDKEDLLGIFSIQEFRDVFDTWKRLVDSEDIEKSDLAWADVFKNAAANYFLKTDETNDFLSNQDFSNVNLVIKSFSEYVSKSAKSFNNTSVILPYLNKLLQLKNNGVKITELIDLIKEFPKINKNLPKEEFDYIRKECEANNTWKDLYGYFCRLEKKKKEMKEKLDLYHAKKYNALYLLTIHKSKGLTFDNVFVIGCYDGGIPNSRAASLNSVDMEVGKQKAEPPCILEEERRLMYVAVTRPRDNLYVTFPSSLQGKPSVRSQFLGELMLPIKKAT